MTAKRRLLLSLAAGAAVAGIAVGHAEAFNPDTLVSVGSPTSPFSLNKQYEPAVAIDADNPNILVAGANDNASWPSATLAVRSASFPRMNGARAVHPQDRRHPHPIAFDWAYRSD
jgi:hypothetical protein